MNNNKRSRNTGAIVREIFIEHPDWNAREIYDRYLDKVDKSRAVTLNAIQKQVQRLRERYQEIQDTGLDNPWHLGTLDKYPLPAEAIPYIFLVQTWLEMPGKEMAKILKVKHYLSPKSDYVSIRQGLWIARLYGMVKKNVKDKKGMLQVAEFLGRWSEAYAEREIICELKGISPPDMSELDKSLRNFEYPIVTIDHTIITFNQEERSFYIDSANEKLLQQMEQMKKEGEK